MTAIHGFKLPIELASGTRRLPESLIEDLELCRAGGDRTPLYEELIDASAFDRAGMGIAA